MASLELSSTNKNTNIFVSGWGLLNERKQTESEKTGSPHNISRKFS